MEDQCDLFGSTLSWSEESYTATQTLLPAYDQGIASVCKKGCNTSSTPGQSTSESQKVVRKNIASKLHLAQAHNSTRKTCDMNTAPKPTEAKNSDSDEIEETGRYHAC